MAPTTAATFRPLTGDIAGKLPSIPETSRVATIPLVPRDVAHLPTQRWHWSARRRMAHDHPFARIAQMEANLELLVAELETEVDRLVACSERLLDGNPKA